MRAYGIDHVRTQDDFSRLGIAYSVANQFEAAEKELQLANPDVNSVNGLNNKFNLADVFAGGGSFIME